jgi:hypothetical protein
MLACVKSMLLVVVFELAAVDAGTVTPGVNAVVRVSNRACKQH